MKILERVMNQIDRVMGHPAADLALFTWCAGFAAHHSYQGEMLWAIVQALIGAFAIFCLKQDTERWRERKEREREREEKKEKGEGEEEEKEMKEGEE